MSEGVHPCRDRGRPYAHHLQGALLPPAVQGPEAFCFVSAVGCSPFFLPPCLAESRCLKRDAGSQPRNGSFWTPGTQTEARSP